jgi:D-inositol-3-phosphate glycosyltransferase
VTARRRVALVVPDYRLEGGLKTVTRYLQDVIEQSGDYDYTVISLATSSTDEASTQLRQPRSWFRAPQLLKLTDGDFSYWHVGCHFAELEFMRYLPRLILTQLLSQFDVVQVVAGSPAWGVTTSLVRRPVVLKTATLIGLERRALLQRSTGFGGLWRRAMTVLTGLLDGLALRRADIIIVINDQMFQRLSQRSGKVRLAPPGVDTDFFTPPAGDASRTGFILSVGRLDDPRKNASLLFYAYRALLDLKPEAPDLVLAGKSMPSAPDQKLIETLGLTGRVHLRADLTLEELRALYQEAGVFWLSSDEEGLGLVVLEAMACGVPAVSTRSGGPESIIQDGINGYLTPRGDAAALADRTALLFDAARWRAFSQAARQRVEQTYSARVTSQAYLDAYDQLTRRVRP